jgi:alkaline phosphatase
MDQPLLDTEQQTPRRKRSIKLLAVFAGSTILLVTFILAYLLSPSARVRGVILLIPDGFGPASQTMARTVHFVERGINTLPLDSILVGTSRTKSASSWVTDSAAGATAFSCAKKTVNGAIAVTPENLPCGTVLEAAKEKQMLTALVATSRITHATPAAFSAHVQDRDSESLIALYQIGNYSLGRQVDLMFGGGMCFFLPANDTGSCRSDNVNVLQRAANSGWNIIHDKPSFDLIDKNTPLPVMGLFASSMMAYEIDRNATVEPSLKEMARTALDIINHASRKNGKGFFIMIEGSRIDMAAHR